MSRMKLRTKLIAASLVIMIVPMVVSVAMVSVITTRQNRSVSFDRIDKSLNIVRDDLAGKQAKLLSDAFQLAGVNGMGSRIKFLFGYKGKSAIVTMATNICKEATRDLLQVARAGDLWQAAVYDLQGDLLSFTLRKDERSSTLGYVMHGEKTAMYAGAVEAGQELTEGAWKEVEKFPDANLKLKFGKEIPKEPGVVFEIVDHSLCLAAYAPVTADEYNKDTDQPEKRQFGVAVAVVKIDESFTKKMSFLTGMRVNLFEGDTLSCGDLPEYSKLQPAQVDGPEGKWELSRQKFGLNDALVESGKYFQGVLPLFGSAGPVATVAALYSQAAARENTWQVVRLLSLIYLGCILVVIPLALWFSSGLARPINAAIEALTGSAGEVFRASGHVLDSSRKLSEAASEQATSVEETSASLEEMSSMTRLNAENAGHADGLSKQASQDLVNAKESMRALIQSMQATSTASADVAKIIGSIDAIAFQTNLLALNAAVEAARAGESGAGFAVVAEEVRNLAMRVAEAAGNTQEMVLEIIRRIEEGSQLVRETDERYRNVAVGVQKVTELIGEISSGSREQASGIDQVNRAVADIDKMTQQNAAHAENSAAASRQLSAQSERMGTVVEQLAALVGRAGLDGYADEEEPDEPAGLLPRS